MTGDSLYSTGPYVKTVYLGRMKKESMTGIILNNLEHTIVRISMKYN